MEREAENKENGRGGGRGNEQFCVRNYGSMPCSLFLVRGALGGLGESIGRYAV